MLGGNRSGKTIYGARSVVRAAIENPERRSLSSRRMRGLCATGGAAVYDWLPPDLRKTSRSKGHYISYKRQTGFAGASMIFPNGSNLIWKTYSQFSQDASVIEGAELGSFDPGFVNWGASLTSI